MNFHYLRIFDRVVTNFHAGNFDFAGRRKNFRKLKCGLEIVKNLLKRGIFFPDILFSLKYLSTSNRLSHIFYKERLRKCDLYELTNQE